MEVVGARRARLRPVRRWFLCSLFQPFHGDGEGRVRSTIPTGAGVAQIADVLEEDGVVDSAFFFRARASWAAAAATSSRGPTPEGRHELRRRASTRSPRGRRTNVVTVTIPEGRRAAEIAPSSRAPGSTGNYERASVSSPGFDPARLQARRARENLEGFLFPATYELKRGASARRLVDEQLDAFERALRHGRPAHGEAQEPHPLRRADHRLDGRARGRACPRSAR